MMKKLKASEIRQKYLDFFVEKGHMVEPSVKHLKSQEL